MANSTGSGSPSLDTINNIFGTSLEFPKCFRKPGTASNFELATGSGHTGFNGAAHTANLNPTSPISSMMNGIAQDNGYRNIFGALTVTGKTVFLGGFTGETAFWKLNTGSWAITSGAAAAITAGGALKLTASNSVVLASTNAVVVNSSRMQGTNTVMAGFDITACTGKKPFDIKHPTKSGWRLRHVCIEGPTGDVYVRGVLNSSNVIELPDYWVGLVDHNTITVNLTPMSVYQELFVDKIENNKIYIKNNSGGMIKCNYLICAERKDVEKNIPEYEGNYSDYPGDNSQYALSIMNITGA